MLTCISLLHFEVYISTISWLLVVEKATQHTTQHPCSQLINRDTCADWQCRWNHPYISQQYKTISSYMHKQKENNIWYLKRCIDYLLLDCILVGCIFRNKIDNWNFGKENFVFWTLSDTLRICGSKNLESGLCHHKVFHLPTVLLLFCTLHWIY